MNFFSKIKNSVYGPSYYKEVFEKPLSYSVKYFFLLILLFAVLNTIFVSIKFIPVVKDFIDTGSEKVLSFYPEELEVKVINEQVFTNVEEPYYIKIDKKLPNGEIDPSGEKINLIVIDTKNDFNLERMNAYNSVIWITKDSFVSSDARSGEISIQNLKDVPNFTLNKSNISKWLSKIKPLLKYAIPAMIVLAFLGIYLAKVFYLVYLLFGALIVYLVSKALSCGLGFKKSYQLGMHLVTGAFFCTFLWSLVFNSKPIFLFSIFLMVFAFLNLRGLTNKPVEKQEEPKPQETVS